MMSGKPASTNGIKVVTQRDPDTFAAPFEKPTTLVLRLQTAHTLGAKRP